MTTTEKRILDWINSPTNSNGTDSYYGKRYLAAARKLEAKGLVTVEINGIVVTVTKIKK
jgi:hypothetical protein